MTETGKTPPHPTPRTPGGSEGRGRGCQKTRNGVPRFRIKCAVSGIGSPILISQAFWLSIKKNIGAYFFHFSGTLAGRDRGANFLIRLEAIDFNFIEMRCRIPPKEKITITIHPLLFDRIEKLRSQYQISRSEMVREALDRYLEAIERAEGIAA